MAKAGQGWYRYVKGYYTCTQIQPLTNSSTHGPGVKASNDANSAMPISCVERYSRWPTKPRACPKTAIATRASDIDVMMTPAYGFPAVRSANKSIEKWT
jgi:hypothetical protein